MSRKWLLGEIALTDIVLVSMLFYVCTINRSVIWAVLLAFWAVFTGIDILRFLYTRSTDD